MDKVIITGADGFVGNLTVEKFLENGIKVLAIDIVDIPCRLKKHPNLKYIKLDVSEPQKLLEKVEKNKFDTFVHFAWAGSAGKARIDYNLQMKNALNTVECMKCAKELGCSRFVCAGSIMEKEVEAAIHTQESRPGLAYIYGMAKLIAHCMCKSVAADIKIDLIWPMITNAYGEGEFSPRFVNTTIRKIINKEPLQFTAAIQNYDFVHVEDVAEAFYLISKNGKPFCEYLIGSSKAKQLKDFILEMQQELDPSAIPLFGDVPFTGTNMPLDTFNTTNTEKDCFFKAKISFAEGTRRTMDWLIEIDKEG